MHCIDLGESFPTHIYLQNLASIQPRTSSLKVGRLPNGGKLLGVEAAEAGPGDGPRGADSLLDSSALDWALIDTIARKLGGTVVVAPQLLSKLYRARSRLYRNQILQENMRLKALAEIYKMHSFALL